MQDFQEAPLVFQGLCRNASLEMASSTSTTSIAQPEKSRLPSARKNRPQRLEGRHVAIIVSTKPTDLVSHSKQRM